MQSDEQKKLLGAMQFTLTLKKAMELRGFTNNEWDVLPQSIFDEIYDIAGENPLGHVVYAYGSFGGNPYPVTDKGMTMLMAWNRRNI